MSAPAEQGLTRLCWRERGLAHDRACPHKSEVDDCRRCSEYTRIGRSVFDRPVTEDQREEWTRTLSKMRRETRRTVRPVFMFRVGLEWLATPVETCHEVTERRFVHAVPSKTNGAFLGLANVNGELILCVSLPRVLALPDAPRAEDAGRFASGRMVVLDRSSGRYMFEVDEVAGVVGVAEDEWVPVPSTVSQDHSSITTRAFHAGDRVVGLLDPVRLLAALNRSIGL